MKKLTKFITNNKIKITVIFLTVVFVLLVLALFSFFSYKESLAEDTISVWDGTVAESFNDGDGSKTEPYIITTGSELAYLFSLLNSTDNLSYFNKYYEIKNSIDLNNYDFSFLSTDNTFKGHLNGNGYTIYNLKIETPYQKEDSEIYSLFNSLEGAEISYINFENITINTIKEEAKDDEEPSKENEDISKENPKKVYASLLGIDVKDSEIHNINLNNYQIKGTDATTSGIIINDNGYNNFYNINIDLKSDLKSSQLIYNYDSAKEKTDEDDLQIGNIIYTNKDLELINDYEVTKENTFYHYDNEEELEFDEISSDEFLDMFNSNSLLNWEIDNNQIYIKRINLIADHITMDALEGIGSLGELNRPKMLLGAPMDSAPFIPEDSGIRGGTVYINDLDKDYNYYMSLNYTEVIDGNTLPTYENRYNDNNLIRTEIIYSGTDFNDSSLVGEVSPTESEDTYIYYKYYPLNSDNTITIELIDNPFSARPTNRGFNGWATSYERAEIFFDQETYTRYVTVPVDSSKSVSITMNAIWSYANIQTGGTGSLSSLDNAGMKGMIRTVTTTTTQTVEYDCNPYFNQQVRTIPQNYTGRVNNGNNIPANSFYYIGTSSTYSTTTNFTYVANQTRCSTSGGNNRCYYFTPTTINANANYNENTTYRIMYQYNTNYYRYTTDTSDYVTYRTCTRDEQVTETHDESLLNDGDDATGYYYSVGRNYSSDPSAYYDSLGRNCSKSPNTCSSGAYKLIQPDDTLTNTDGTSISEINEVGGNVVDLNNYYYLVTRDMNILVVNTTGTNISNFMNAKPYTLTSTYDGSAITNSNVVANTATASNDMVIENIKIQGVGGSTVSETASATTSLNANCHNVKIGRNVTYISNRNVASDVNKIFNGVFGIGSNYDGTSTKHDRFRVMVESGNYNYLLSGTADGSGNTRDNFYLNADFMYGSDYDRVNNDDAKLKVYFNALSTIKDNFVSTSANKALPSSTIIIKSGRYGKTSGDAYSTSNTNGIYAGGRTTTHYANALRVLKVEGGDTNIINGGPCVENNLTSNTVAIYMTGGLVRQIYGGAGTTTTYGNRIVSVSGGQVTYSIFGGSNAYNSGSEGLLTGSTLVYVGGNAEIGDEDLDDDDELFNVSSGNVFGAGNGADGGTSAGIVSNSHVIINGGIIRGSVYGGGNHGSVGTNNTNDAESKATIDILAGSILDSVYGAGESAGGGYASTQTSSSVSYLQGDYYTGYTTVTTRYVETTVTVTRDNTGAITSGPTTTTNTTNGNIPRNAYLPDGSRTDAQVTCSSSVVGATITGPTSQTSTSRQNQGSWLRPDYYTTTTVTTTTTTTCAYATAIAHEGDTYNSRTNYYEIQNNNFVQVTPELETNWDGSNTYQHTVTINLKGGNVTNGIYGGSNTAGTLYGNVNINLTEGTAGSVYGGGRGVSGTTDEEDIVKVMGNTTVKSKIKEDADDEDLTVGSLYGGSAFGTVNTYGNTTVEIDGGTFTNVYGGGEGDANTAPETYGNIEVTVKDGVITNLYGGNNLNGIPSNAVDVYLQGGEISNAFGGGSSSSVRTSNIHLQGAEVGNLFGGSNSSGDVRTANVYIESGTANYVYGGNNSGGTTLTSIVTCTGGTVSSTDNDGAVYGGGKNATTGSTNVLMDGTVATYVFGGGESAAVTNQTHVNIENGVFEGIYGGSNITGDVPVTVVEANGGSTNYIYGGGKNATTGTTNVIMDGIRANYAFGGGESADVITRTNITLESGEIGSIYGGSNTLGTVPETNVTINDGGIDNVYGGNNQGGTVTETNVIVNGGDITNLYGGGDSVGVTTTNIDLNGGIITNTYGGSNTTGNVTTSNINALGGSLNNIKVRVETESDLVNPYTQNTDYTTVNNVKVTLTNKSSSTIDDWQVELTFPDETILYTNESHSVVPIIDNVAVIDASGRESGVNSIAPGASYVFEFAVYSTANIDDFNVTYRDVTPAVEGIDEADLPELTVANVYGGNNQGGVTTNANITLTRGTYGNIFGGGNEAITGDNVLELSNITAANIYGGGNKARTNNNVVLDLEKVTVTGSLYGGGNEAPVGNNTYLSIDNTNIIGNAFGGGNAASVEHNAYTNVSGDTIIGGNLFGGGNSGTIGTENGQPIQTILNITGANVGGNVYGGCNTSIVYGATAVNIGSEAVGNPDLDRGDINITGTVFGGGESNAEGSTIIDYDFISVTHGIDINIDGTDYLNNNYDFSLSGSIFGSGNASQSAGESNIYIGHLGTRDNPSRNVSIQRSTNVVIDDSVIELKGTTDSANYYGDIKYSLNRINSFKIKNNTTLLLRENANLLKTFISCVDVDGDEEIATVDIDEETHEVTKNVDNRLYLLAGQVLNVATNDDATAYGRVTGMTFLGMYNAYANGSIAYGLYGYNMETGSAADGGDVIIGGSYVLGLHANNHDITVDGFYTNYIDDDYTEITTNYVDPTPPDATFYRWIIGTSSVNYSFSLTGSKYSSLGTEALSLIDFSAGNTTFRVIGFSSEGLSSDVSLVDASAIPKLASSPTEANHTLGLSMKTETTEWTSNDTTKFYSTNGGTMVGADEYATDNVSNAPTIMFYLYHAKNITRAEDLGTAVITLEAAVPKNEIEFEIKLVTITITLQTRVYEDDDAYDASITYGRKYDIPSATNVNITNESQFTAYYSLIADATDIDNVANKFHNYSSYKRAIVSDLVLPEGTTITMADLAAGDTPEYYYYTVTSSEYTRALNQYQTIGEADYYLSNFIKMDSSDTDNTYDESSANNIYYHPEIDYIFEEFVFIFDFKDANQRIESLDNSMLFELRTAADDTILSVLGSRRGLMTYSLYNATNAALEQTSSMEDQYVYYDTDKPISFSTNVKYDQTDNRTQIIDTNYESSSMGITATIKDTSGNIISSQLLSGAYLQIGNKKYHTDSNGIFRIRLASKVSNITQNIIFNTSNTLPTGTYTMTLTLFASQDGLHESLNMESSVVSFPITVVGSDNMIVVDLADKEKIITAATALNENGTNTETFNIKYDSELLDPNIRVIAYKRDTSTISTSVYNEYSMRSIFNGTFTFASAMGYRSTSSNEFFVTRTPSATQDITYTLRDTLTSGTYKIVFRLYDGNNLIDEDSRYIIILKDEEIPEEESD